MGKHTKGLNWIKQIIKEMSKTMEDLFGSWT